MEALEWLAWPFAICVVLVGIHGYLGIHVLARKVIFVDLAMAQVAALGATYAFALGYDPSRPEDQGASFAFSVAFALAGAAVFAFTRMRHEKVPQEAFIGIVYASATAIAILVLAKLPHGGEHLRRMFEGNILFVQGPAVLSTALIYAAVGLFHWIFRRKFFLISFEPERAMAEGVRVRLWDFLFYASFGVVITSSVAVAGVLLVFTYLVVPACVAVLFAEGARSRLMLAWIVGVVVTVAGMWVSYYGSFPTGPAVVGAFAVVLALAGIAHAIRVSPRPARAAARVGASLAGLVLLAWGTVHLRKAEVEHGHHEDEFARYVEALHGGEEPRVIDAIDHLADSGDAHAPDEFLKLLKTGPSDLVTEHLAHGLAKLGHAPAIPSLVEAAARARDASLKVDIARAILALRGVEGFRILIDVLASDPPAVWKAEAEKTLAAVGAPVKDAAALRTWWETKGRALKWRDTTKRFD
ncbi:MAG TPA: iron chelate uptake ABC transporter family permease subunit [Planctomycetota bacterium]|nr:iron chelate uptake ABC transporter family permease subunit [Planctomycetota bacterium]